MGVGPVRRAGAAWSLSLGLALAAQALSLQVSPKCMRRKLSEHQLSQERPLSRAAAATAVLVLVLVLVLALVLALVLVLVLVLVPPLGGGLSRSNPLEIPWVVVACGCVPLRTQ